MRIVQVVNNNLVLAVDGVGHEAVLMGRGLGYHARPGQLVDQGRVLRTFVPLAGDTPGHLIQRLSGLPPEHVELVILAMAEIGIDRLAGNHILVIALADHVSFALRRAASGTSTEYPLVAEVQHLYPEEYAQAQALLAAINVRIGTPLPDAEAVALALHLVNASFSTGDLSETYRMTGLIKQMISVIEQMLGLDLDPGSVGVGRFVLHLRYLFVRVRHHKQFDQKHSMIGAAVRAAYPTPVECARRIAALLEIRLGAALTDDEVSYLALHVARVGTDRD